MIKWSFCSSTPEVCKLIPGNKYFSINHTDMNTSRISLTSLPAFSAKIRLPRKMYSSRKTLFPKKKKFIRFLSCYARFWLRICRLILSRLVWCLVAMGENEKKKFSCQLKLFRCANKLNFGRSNGRCHCWYIAADGWMGGWGKSFAQVFSSVRYIFAANTTFDRKRKKNMIRKWKEDERATRWISLWFYPSALSLKVHNLALHA